MNFNVKFSDQNNRYPVKMPEVNEFIGFSFEQIQHIEAVGIKKIVFNDDYTMTVILTDGTSVTSMSLRGKDGNGIADAHLNDDYTLTLNFDNGNSYTTPSIRGADGTSAIHSGTTEYWNSQIGFTGNAGEMYVYTDHEKIVDEDGNERFVAGLKMSDGLAFLIDQPFITEAVESKLNTHVYDMGIHVTQEEKDFWNNKVRCYDGVEEELVFTTL